MNEIGVSKMINNMLSLYELNWLIKNESLYVKNNSPISSVIKQFNFYLSSNKKTGH